MIKKYVRWLIVSGLVPVAGGIALLIWLLQKYHQQLQTETATPGRIILPEEPEAEVQPLPKGESIKETIVREAVARETAPKKAAPKKAAATKVTPEPEPDDLTAIEGIGPKIASVLQEAGVRTFAQLAEMSSEQIKAALEGKVRIANSGTWTEQAALAARGDWDGLAALQSSLKGGRRV